MSIEQHLQDMEKSIAAIRMEQKPPPEQAIPVPMVECNWPEVEIEPGKTYLQACVAGLQAWYGVVDKCLVVTMPSRAYDLYESLAERTDIPDIVPGLKGWERLGEGFFDLTGWQKLVADIINLRNQTNRDTIYIGLEKACKAYVAGEEAPAWRVIEWAMDALPDDLTIMWYPGNHWPGKTEQQHQRLYRLVNGLNRGKRSRFATQRFESSTSWGNPVFIEHWNWLNEHTDNPYAIAYWHTPGYWGDDQLIEVLETVAREAGSDTEVMIYPGVARWEELSPVLAGQLKGGN